MLRAAAVLALFVSTPAVARPGEVPAAFRGEWHGDRITCGEGADDSMLILERRRLELYESAGKVRSVITRGDDELRLIVHLSDGQHAADQPFEFVLSQDGQRLAEVSEGDVYLRWRCLTPSRSSRPPTP
jgi:hypothetical protein